MTRLSTFLAIGLAVSALPALAVAQTTPSQPPPAQPPQSQPMQQRPMQSQPMRSQQAGTAQDEAATAHAHALMAQGAQSVKMAHTHLHHVVNCLEGPTGTDFDAKAGNPCKGKGQGALADSMGNEALHGRLQQALDQAQSGLQSDDLKTIQADAAEAAGLLQAPPAG